MYFNLRVSQLAVRPPINADLPSPSNCHPQITGFHENDKRSNGTIIATSYWCSSIRYMSIWCAVPRKMWGHFLQGFCGQSPPVYMHAGNMYPCLIPIHRCPAHMQHKQLTETTVNTQDNGAGPNKLAKKCTLEGHVNQIWWTWQNGD